MQIVPLAPMIAVKIAAVTIVLFLLVFVSVVIYYTSSGYIAIVNYYKINQWLLCNILYYIYIIIIILIYNNTCYTVEVLEVF